MDVDHEEKLLLMEVQKLCDETMAKSSVLLSDQNEKDVYRRQMAFSLLSACRDLGQFLPEDEENWLDSFGETLEATIEAEEARLEEFRFDEDRRKRIIVLANLRILRRLRNRLTSPRRRQSLIPEIYTDPLYPPHPEVDGA